jgi:hypothetical protein
MSTFNGDSYVDFRNINLKGGASGTGLIRWNPASSYGTNGALWATNPFGTADYGLYINGSGQLVFSSAGSATVLGTPGGAGTIPTFNAVFGQSSTLQLGGVATFTIDNSTGNNNVLTLTNTGGGSGVLLQITNVGSGSDIAGTSGTWTFSKTGVATFLTATLAGSAGATSLELTLGNIVVDAGGISLTKAANSATLTVVNNTATTASVVVISGSAAYTGSTTTSFMTISPTGLTTGTAVYIPTVALSTGIALQLNYAGTTSLTTGKMFYVLSSATAMQSTSRLFLISHTGISSASGAGILCEHISAATDATDIMKITASSTITGSLMWLAMASSLTGIGLSIPNCDALTTGYGINVTGSTTALTTTGRLFLVSHSGATTSTGTVAEFITAATDGTVLLKLTSAASVSGINLSIVGTTGMTTGSLIRATSSTAAAVATNGIYSFLLTGAFTSGASTVGAFHVAGAATVSGTIMSILGGAQTTGIALNITDPSTGMTSGSLLRVITATTGAVATNGIVSIQASGAYTSTSNAGLLNVSASAAVGAATLVNISASAASQTATNLLNVVQSGATITAFTGSVASFTGAGTTGTGNTVLVTSVNTTAGDGVKIVSNALTVGAATALNVSHTTSVLGAGTSMVRITSTSADTGSTTGTLLDLAQTGVAAGNVAVLLTDNSSSVTARTGVKINFTNASAVLATPFAIANAGVTGTGSKFKLAGNFCGYNIWVSTDGTSPNGALGQTQNTNVTAGDICLGTTGGKMAYCTSAATNGSWSILT